jgi:hypothetical protein
MPAQEPEQRGTRLPGVKATRCYQAPASYVTLAIDGRMRRAEDENCGLVDVQMGAASEWPTTSVAFFPRADLSFWQPRFVPPGRRTWPKMSCGRLVPPR